MIKALLVLIPILITAIPNSDGTINSKFRAGDKGTPGPSTPAIGPVAVFDHDSANIVLQTPSTGGTAPLHYETEITTDASCLSGWSIENVDAVFTSDGVYLLDGLAASTSYCVRLTGVDNVNLRSGVSDHQIFVTTAAPVETTRPSQVTGVTASSTIAGQATFSWAAATDNVGVVCYQILLGEGDETGTETPVGSGSIIEPCYTGGLTYVRSNLIPGDEYYFRAKALDAAGNISLNTSDRAWVTIEEEVEGPCGGGECAGVAVETFEGLTVGQLAWAASPDWDEVQPRDSDQGFINGTACRTGTRCMVSTINRDELPSGHSNERNEVKWETPTQFVGANSTAVGHPTSYFRSTQHTWIGFSVFVPATWKAIWKRTGSGPDLSKACDGIVVMQIHSNNGAATSDRPASGAEQNPPFKLILKCSPTNAANALPAWQVEASRNTVVPSSGSNTDSENVIGPLVELGQWTDFVMWFNYNPTAVGGVGGGFARVYLKNHDDTVFTKIFDSQTEFGSLGFGYARQDTGNRPYFKYGGYFSFWNMDTSAARLTVTSTNVEIRTIQLKYDETRLYDDSTLTEAEGIEHVQPRD